MPSKLWRDPSRPGLSGPECLRNLTEPCQGSSVGSTDAGPYALCNSRYGGSSDWPEARFPTHMSDEHGL